MHASMDLPSNGDSTLGASSPAEDTTNLGDEERGLTRPPHSDPAVPAITHSRASPTLEENTDHDDTGARNRPNSISSSASNFIKRKTSQLLEAVTSSSQKSGDVAIAPRLSALVDAYRESGIAAGIRTEGEELRAERERQVQGQGVVGNELPDIALETSLLRGRKRASMGTQFRILSGRAFKNLYRNPALLAAHYLSSIALASEFAFQLSQWAAYCCRFLMISVYSYLRAFLPQCNVSEAGDRAFAFLLSSAAMISLASKTDSVQQHFPTLPRPSILSPSFRHLLLYLVPLWVLLLIEFGIVRKRADSFHARKVITRSAPFYLMNRTNTSVRSNGYYSSFTYFSSKVSATTH